MRCPERPIVISRSPKNPPEAKACGPRFSRSGIETGPAIVGDVGIRSKLDYIAHGDAVSMAARLEACNKELGSAICCWAKKAAIRLPSPKGASSRSYPPRQKNGPNADWRQSPVA
jgi:class 3 adenylate cyclase